LSFHFNLVSPISDLKNLNAVKIMTDTKEEDTSEQEEDNITKIIHEYVFHMYQMEWQRTHDIENKVTSIVGFVGVILSLTIGSLSTIIACSNEVIRQKVFSSYIFSSIIVIILALMILSIFYGIMALSVKEWGFFQAIDFCDYTKDDFKGKRPTQKELYKEITESFEDLIAQNSDINKQIAKYLNYSYSLFFVSLVLLVFYFIHILDVSI